MSGQYEIPRVISTDNEGLRPLFAARIHIFSGTTNRVACRWSLSLSVAAVSGGVVNVKTLIVMSCDTGEEREEADRHADGAKAAGCHLT